MLRSGNQNCNPRKNNKPSYLMLSTTANKTVAFIKLQGKEIYEASSVHILILSPGMPWEAMSTTSDRCKSFLSSRKQR